MPLREPVEAPGRKQGAVGETMRNNSLIPEMKIALKHRINISTCGRKESGGVGGGEMRCGRGGEKEAISITADGLICHSRIPEMPFVSAVGTHRADLSEMASVTAPRSQTFLLFSPPHRDAAKHQHPARGWLT